MNKHKKIEFLGRKVQKMLEKYHKDYEQLIITGHKDKASVLSSQLKKKLQPYVSEILETNIKNE